MTLVVAPIGVAAHAEETPFSLDQYRWKHRVLVVSAPNQDDEHFRAQLDALVSTDDEFANRDMLLVALVDDGASTTGGRQLASADVSAVRKVLRIQPDSFALRLIGKDGGVKLSTDAVTPVSEIYALIDRMPMRRREMSDRQ